MTRLPRLLHRSTMRPCRAGLVCCSGSSLLGIPGAILYRLTRAALQQRLDVEEMDWMARLRLVLDLPVIGLMVAATAMCGDLDRVHRVWRDAAGSDPLWGLTPATLDKIAAELLPEGADFREALISGQQMVLAHADPVAGGAEPDPAGRLAGLSLISCCQVAMRRMHCRLGS